MKTSRFTSMLYLPVLLCFLTAASSSAQAQATDLTGTPAAVAEFFTAVNGTIVQDDFTTLINADTGMVIEQESLELLLNPQPREFGQLSGPISDSVDADSDFAAVAFSASSGTNEAGVSVTAIVSLLEPDAVAQPVVFTFNNPDRGLLSGFSFSLIRPDPDAPDVLISIFDGDTLLESFTVSGDAENIGLDDNGFESFGFGFINDNEFQNITRAEVLPIGGGDFNGVLITEAQFAFSDVEPVAETPFEQFTNVLIGLDVLLATTDSKKDSAFLRNAIRSIERLQRDFFREQPSSDNASINANSIFQGATQAVKFLQRVNDPQADVLTDEILDALANSLNF